MPLSSCTRVYRFQKVKFRDDRIRSQVEIVLNDFQEVLIRKTLFDSALRINLDREGLGDSYALAHLHLAPFNKACMDQTLRDPSSCLSCRSVDLSWVFS